MATETFILPPEGVQPSPAIRRTSLEGGGGSGGGGAAGGGTAVEPGDLQPLQPASAVQVREIISSPWRTKSICRVGRSLTPAGVDAIGVASPLIRVHAAQPPLASQWR